MITPAVAAEIVTTEHGSWMLSQMGRDGLDDLLWDSCPEYQRMPLDKRARFRDAVGEEIFG